MEDIKNWYVVHTRPRWEKKVAGMLEKNGTETYCPVHKVERQWSDRKKTIDLPLFTSYVFLHVKKSEHRAIRDTDGVINFVYWLGQPAIIKDEEIAVVRNFLRFHKHIKVGQIKVGVGDTVRIIHGPLSMLDGDVVSIKNQKVKVLLPSLGYVLVAEVEKMNLK